MKKYRLFTVFSLILIFLININSLLAQDNINQIYEELSKNLKYRFEDEIFKYRSLIFKTSNKIDDKYDVQLKTNVFVKINGKNTFPLEIHRFKSDAQTYYTVFTFTKNNYNHLFLKNGEYDLDLSDDSINKLLITEPDKMLSTLFVYYAKKDLESLKVENPGTKYGNLTDKLKILENYENNPYFYEAMAYLNIFKDTIINVTVVSDFFDKSKELENKDCIFLRNYTNWNYKLADSLYKRGGDIEMDKQTVMFLEKVVDNNVPNCTIDSASLLNSKYMLAYCLYNIYISQSVADIENLTKIETLLKVVSEKKDDLTRRNKSLLLLGNVYDLMEKYPKAIEKYEEILNNSNSLDEQLKKLTEEYLEEVKSKVKQ